MDKQDRRRAIAAFKEIKPGVGVYAVLCRATGEAWVGCSRNLEGQKNGFAFMLKHGTSPDPTLKAALTAHAAEDFAYEELERLRDDFPPLRLRDELKSRQRLWTSRLLGRSLPS